MRIVTYIALLTTLLAVAACDGTGMGSGKAVEYRAEELAYDTGDSYTERYLLYADDGTYERYIGGTYRGHGMGSTYYGTLFETGTYEEDSERGTVQFSSKKGYDFDTKRLVNLGIYDRETRDGTLTDTTLTVEYRIECDDYTHYYYPHYHTIELSYKRK
ncbi:MAG: hypothetical protein K2J14_02255 [Treponemataceae bacterium]|nr:hypothetical protein [Treponemataceae bacterium]